VPDARVDIYSVNFGDRAAISRRRGIRCAPRRPGSLTLGHREDAKRLALALTRIDEAQRMAGQLNQDANAMAADAAKTINELLVSTATR